MLNNITIDTTNIVANKNIHENIFKARKSNNILNNNKENNSVPLPSPSPKHDDYLSRSQLNRGLSRFAALGTAVEERERVLQLQEALQSKTNEFEQRNLLLIRSKDALEELGKRCSEAQERADASASEVIALASAAEVAQNDLISMQEKYENDMETMEIKFTSLEHEVVRLKELENKFKHFKFVEKVALQARNEKENELYHIIGQQNDTIEAERKNVFELKLKYDNIVKEQNEHIKMLKKEHANEINVLQGHLDASLAHEIENKKKKTAFNNNLINGKRHHLRNSSKTSGKSKRSNHTKPEAVVLAQVLNRNNSPKGFKNNQQATIHDNNNHNNDLNENSRLRLINNQMDNMKLLLNNERNETNNLRMKIQQEKEMREQLCERLKSMEYQMYNNNKNNSNIANQNDNNRSKVIITSKKKTNNDNIVNVTTIQNSSAYGLDNDFNNTNNGTTIMVTEGKKVKIKKKLIKKKINKKKRKKKKVKKTSTEMIKLHIPKATARILLAYRENLC